MTKVEQVARQLKDRLVSMADGERIPSEKELCEAYGVSRLTIRGALGVLSAQGMVETQRGKGSFARKPASLFAPEASRIDLFEFRRILETESARLAASRADRATIERLRDEARLMQSATSQQDIARHDEQFHLLLAQATRNAVILQVFDLLKSAFWVMFRQNVSVLGAQGSEYHLKIVAAIEARNPELAGQYMREHLNLAMESTNMLNYAGRAGEDEA